MSQNKNQQLVFEEILERADLESDNYEKELVKTNKISIVKKVKRAVAKTPQYAVRLVHESGVDWRLDCYHNGEEMTPEHYNHLAIEGLKRGLIKELKQEPQNEKVIQIISLVLQNLGAEIPQSLMIDQNKNLFEGDFWSEFQSSTRKHFDSVSSSYLWAFYFSAAEGEINPLEIKFINFPDTISALNSQLCQTRDKY